MFDVGWSEVVVIGVVALVVIGPKELPGVIRTVGRAVGKLRTMAGDFRTQFDDAMREADLHEVKKTFTEAADAATSAATSFTEPVSEIKNEIHAATSDVSSAVNVGEPAAAPVVEAPAPAAEPEAEAAPAPKKRRKKADTAGEGA